MTTHGCNSNIKVPPWTSSNFSSKLSPKNCSIDNVMLTLFVCLFICLWFPVDQVSKQINYTNSIKTGGDSAASVINGTGGISIVRNGGSGITITCFYNSSGKSINDFKEFFVVSDTGLYMSALFRRIILSEIKLRIKYDKWAEFSKN